MKLLKKMQTMLFSGSVTRDNSTDKKFLNPIPLVLFSLSAILKPAKRAKKSQHNVWYLLDNNLNSKPKLRLKISILQDFLYYALNSNNDTCPFHYLCFIYLCIHIYI